MRISDWSSDVCSSDLNLRIVTGARATRIILEGRKAVGVTYASGDKLTDLRTRGEVILSGGAINSPQLLMLSGIGDAADLGVFGIPVVVDLPAVGKKLHNHLAITIMQEASARPTTGFAPSFIPPQLAA